MLTDTCPPGHGGGTHLRVDAHHHLWDLAVRDQPWTQGLPALRRNFAIEDLVPLLDQHGIDGTVLVQTVSVAEETPEFLTIAEDEPRVLGVVGWTDLTAPDVAGAIAALRQQPGGEWLVGLRHQVQDETDPHWLLRRDVQRGLAAVAQADLVYDLVVTHDQLSAVVELVSLMPGLGFVLDHAGKPPIASGKLEPWRTRLTQLATHRNVACKLSGLVTEAGEDWTEQQLLRYAEVVLDAFGPDRVMFGSDWPVLLLRTDYGRIVRLVESLVAALSPVEREAVFGGTAQRWYGLHARE